MSENPGAEFFSADDDPDTPTDPLTVATEDWQESEDYQRELAHVRSVEVDSVDVGPFQRKGITLAGVIGHDPATDVAAEGLLLGFEAGFRYGARGGDGAAVEVLARRTVFDAGILWEDLTTENQKHYRAQARAEIESFREGD
jgi:hypothetical protein